ncbi:hypothetical protein [Haliscomenobacter sp.]|uniref:hypothetical protein n=1 Tax=Haliscomenobacter sp. TaxID=2717303 RepID=UPI003593AE07
MKQNIFLFLCTLYSATLLAQEPLYRMSSDKPRWTTFENPKATVGAGGSGLFTVFTFPTPFIFSKN